MPARPVPVMDLSKIDLGVLRSRFNDSRHKNTDLEVLKAAIRTQLDRLLRLNKTRVDFAEKFEELIESYNAGSRNIEELFEELVKLSPDERAQVKRVARDLLRRLKTLLVLNRRQKSAARSQLRLAIEGLQMILCV